MAIGPDEDEPALIERLDVGVLKGNQAQWNAALGGCLGQALGRGRVVAELEEGEALAEQVQRRAPGPDPGVGRSRARAGILNDTSLWHRRRVRAVRADDRRPLVA